ncbi:MAG: phosphate signaling complex protein PhoU [Candidatus Saccharicenans sp.]|nr:phosphate signaling complex protein PhoU [Candidatus Saccharicenans sp.]
MMDRVFDQELNELKEKVARLMTLVGQTFNLTAELLKRQDLSLGAAIAELEQKSDELETDLQKRASVLMARHQPVARDLRLLLVSMNVAHELERIADQCLNISQRLEESRAWLPVAWPPEIEEMVSRTGDMLSSANRAYLEHNEELASQTIGQDIFLDDLKSTITNRYFDSINKRATDPARAVLFILVSRHLEKIGDLAKNIAEESYYLIRGEFIKHLRLTDIYH